MAILRERQVWKRVDHRRAWNSVNTLSHDEQAHVRVALLTLHARHGSWETVARIMNVHEENLLRLATSARHPPSAGIALRAARLAGVPVEDVLSGAFPGRKACPACGWGPTRKRADGHTAVAPGHNRRAKEGR